MGDMTTIPPFHIAVPVDDLSAARSFYGELLGCPEGRSTDQWIDFDLYGHQFVAHLKPGHQSEHHTNNVDKHAVPVPHFGVVLSWEDWEKLAAKLRSVNTQFIIEPYIRFKGEVGEQATMFFYDPSGNALEFKSFKDPDAVFATA